MLFMLMFGIIEELKKKILYKNTPVSLKTILQFF